MIVNCNYFTDVIFFEIYFHCLQIFAGFPDATQLSRPTPQILLALEQVLCCLQITAQHQMSGVRRLVKPQSHPEGGRSNFRQTLMQGLPQTYPRLRPPFARQIPICPQRHLQFLAS